MKFNRLSFRPGQEKVINDILKSFETKKIVVLEAPTGSGKSVIAEAVAMEFSTADFVTIQKGLQAQYTSNSPSLYPMYGASEYRCERGRKHGEFNCDSGPCVLIKSLSRPASCPYMQALEVAKKEPYVVHNFDSFFYQKQEGAKLGIFDECHNIPNKVIDFYMLDISQKDTKVPIPKHNNIGDYDKFLVSFRSEVEEKLYYLKNLDELTVIELEKKNLLERQLEIIGTAIDNLNDTSYVFQYISEDDKVSVIFKPLFGASAVNRVFFSKFKNVLLMSATVLDVDLFAGEIGVSKQDIAYLKFPYQFKIENHSIIQNYVGAMSRNKIQGTLPLLVKEIEKILSFYPTEKGIIQTHTNRISDYIKENISNDRLLFRDDFEKVEDLLREHKQPSNSVIVASGLREGIDLYDDLSRFQIICKVPYPSLGDVLVSRKFNLNKSWYNWITAIMFVQMIGRSIRNKEDYADTFLLDSDFSRWIHFSRKYIPKYVLESFV